MADDNQGQGGGGLTPLVPLGGPSLEDEERAMKGGRGRMLAAMIGAVVAAVAGLVWFIVSQQPSEYGQIGRQINGMRAEYFDGFWGCALPNVDLRDLRDDQRLRGEIAERATSGHAYASHVREECMVRLDEHLPPLAALIVPEDLRAGVDALRAAIEAQRTAWRAFVDHLDHLEGFDAEEPETARHLDAIARAWFDYRQAHHGLNDAIRAHIDD